MPKGKQDHSVQRRVGERIASARLAVGLSQGDLGERLTPPRSHAAVSDIERGLRGLDIDLLVQLGYILSKPLSYFYSELEGGPPPTTGPLTRQRVQQLAEWCRETCLLFGTEVGTAYKVAGEFAGALEKLL